MKRTLPLLITALAGFVLIISPFIPIMEFLGEVVAVWFDILASIAFLLGGGNLLRLQLQTISDRRPGWGYAGVTLASFVITLWLGMFKVGSPPEPSVEEYGVSVVAFPVQELPETRVPGRLVALADGTLLPAEVRPLLRQDGDAVVVRGWLKPTQIKALSDYDDALSWQVLVQDLSEQALPPPQLRGKLSYDPNHSVLAWNGFMSPEQEQQLAALLGSAGQEAVAQLAQAARKETSRDVGTAPSGFVIPATAAASVVQNGTQLTVSGPISPGLRQSIAESWPHFPRVRPQTPAQLQELKSRLEQAGAPLTEKQQAAFTSWFAADWTADLFIQAINSAGVAAPAKKTPKELQAEIQSGVERPALTHAAPAPVLLNPEQEQVVRNFVATPGMDAAQLQAQLTAAGPLTEDMSQRVESFLEEQTTLAQHLRGLCIKLLAGGPLTSAQRDLLLAGAREEFRWQQTVGRLFISAHRPKYPWAGAYDAQGTPFWWMYEYIFQPLTTTTFAVLAFYVASAAFRAFRAKNLEAVLLLGTAFIILLGRTFAGQWLTGSIPDELPVGSVQVPLSAFRIDQMTIYIMSLFTTAGNRAIMIGIALGTISTSLQVLLGIDRSYLGRGNE